MTEDKCLFSMNGMLKTDICHHGIKGQKWGVRRYQNPDGSLTPAGRKRYAQLRKNKNYRVSGEPEERKSSLKPVGKVVKKILKVGLSTAAATAATAALPAVISAVAPMVPTMEFVAHTKFQQMADNLINKLLDVPMFMR